VRPVVFSITAVAAVALPHPLAIRYKSTFPARSMNPYSPPTSDVSKPEPTNRRLIGFVILGLALVQLLWVLFCMSAYLELVRTGAASVITAFNGFVGCILLYVGAAYFAANTARGSRLFFISLIFLFLSLKGWGLQYFWSYPYVAGAAIAIAGWWLSRRFGEG
jgi:hypothetical protein